jgi:polysaccharide export outer membrane protein
MKVNFYIGLTNQVGFPILRALAFIIFPILWGCGAPITIPAISPGELAQLEVAGNFPHHIYRIEPGDTLQIRYTFHPEMNLGVRSDTDKSGGVVVQPDGKIAVPLAGEISVAGMTTTELEKLLVERTSDRLRDPEVVVSIVSFAEKNVYVGGEVGKPGMIPYRKGLSPLQAIIAAGGFLNSGQKDSVLLVRTGGSANNFVSRKLDLAEVIRDGVKEPIYLAPHDVVYVPKTAVAEADLWVQQNITEIIGPFLGLGPRVGMGFRFGQ